MKINKYIQLLLVLIFSSLILGGCIDEEISTDTSLKLEFSSDTISFDTVFTTVGSSTQIVKIYNRNSKNIVISSLKLAGGENSSYRLNVDGVTNPESSFSDIELRAKDSLFIFVEVTIDPQNNNLPVFVKDSILFTTNTNFQDIKLLAYGQDMVLLKKQTFRNDTTLTSAKPYLVMDTLVVDSLATLTLAKGTKFYFHNKASLIVYGNLIANGTLEKPILLRGDRTDKIFENTPYNYVSNQWGGIFLLNRQGNHKLNYVTMNSGYIGVFFFNEDRNYCPNLEIKNSRIHNFLKYGLCVRNGNVTVVNTEISNTGSYSLFLNGGKQTFIHCTIANFFNSTNVRIQPSIRELEPSVLVTDSNNVIPMKTVFENCIITGSNSNELDLLMKEHHIEFLNCYLKKETPDSTSSYFRNIIWANRRDTVFRNTFYDLNKKKYYNFMLDSVSPARNMADITVSKLYPLDINGRNRLEDGKPDVGACEWKSAY